MNDIQLSPHFWLREFLRSQVAARIGRQIVPTDDHVANLRRLCLTVLEPLRVSVAATITVTSGLRPEWLNALVGGSVKSSHVSGCAADIVVAGWRPPEVCREIIRLNLPYNQVILEFDEWTHVSVPDPGTPIARQVLTARVVDGGTVYSAGVV
jgi:zinc D-Ala-D-Ala carboxypeptidase